ncbi:hypothetical protein BC629DRAFT_1600353 [Irpex lacteus]|nr:hypothetical protein BC629DRAFT_1600353 [Irpex lacteus]
MSSSEKALRDALFRWRDDKAKATMGEYYEYGGDILMHYKVVERIVGLVNLKKLKTVQHLKEQTGCAALRFIAIARLFFNCAAFAPSSPLPSLSCSIETSPSASWRSSISIPNSPQYSSSSSESNSVIGARVP